MNESFQIENRRFVSNDEKNVEKRKEMLDRRVSLW